jgi:hypothetical protein
MSTSGAAMVISLTICALGVVGLLSLPDQKYGYNVDPSNDCETTTDEYEYNELSSEAQEAFDSALEADSPVYITDSNHEFDVGYDVEVQNCVRKDSESYVLTVEMVSSGPNPFLELAYSGLSVIGLFYFLVSFAGAARS